LKWIFCNYHSKEKFSVGLTTYSTDERFHVEHARHKGIWDLKIKAVKKEDEGLYGEVPFFVLLNEYIDIIFNAQFLSVIECNLSHHPKKPESIFIFVEVFEALAIIGPTDVHIDEGSTLKLECKIIQATENPTYVFW
jgi:hypothetical protein